MKRTGSVNLPLHSGKAPRWLFERMVKLSREISKIIVYEYSSEEFLKRLSDPYWFQAFSCALGFDWHSSGTTTTTCGALKEAIDPEELGIVVCGGKGKTSRKTPEEIKEGAALLSLSTSKINQLIYASKLSAKVDNSCIQDNYQLYHHSFFFTERGGWVVVQQGMNENFARRYHWLSSEVRSFVNEPHKGICGDKKEKEVLNMVAKESEETRKASVDLVKDNPKHLERFFKKPQKTLEEFSLPKRHPVLEIDIGKEGMKVLQKAYELQPKNYEELISLRGMGPKRIRALALLSDLVYGTKASWKDPAKFSFSHGGKDGFPYPVNKKVYDKSIETLREAIDQAEIGRKEKLLAIKRLHEFLR